MTNDTAKKFIDALSSLESPLGELDMLILELQGAEKEKYKHMLGNLLLASFEMQSSIIKQYPELSPDGGEK